MTQRQSGLQVPSLRLSVTDPLTLMVCSNRYKQAQSLSKTILDLN